MAKPLEAGKQSLKIETPAKQESAGQTCTDEIFYPMTFNELEQKLIRLALCNSAQEGEIINSAELLFKKLRARNITAEQFMQQSSNGSSLYESLYRTAQYRVMSLSTELSDASRTIAKLKADLIFAQERARQQQAPPPPPPQSSSTSTQTPGASTGQPGRPWEPRWKSGFAFLSYKEREFLVRICKRAEERFQQYGADVLSAMHGIASNKIDHGTIQQLLRKGMIEKGWKQGYHKLTQKGLNYYTRYCKTA